MAGPKRRKYVVLINRAAGERASEISSKLKAVPGVAVFSESQSYVDIVADEEVVGTEELKDIVNKLGGELHGSPEAQLIDPIPTKKIP